MSGGKCKSSGDVAGTVKKRQAIMMERKVKVIERVDRGKKMLDIAHSYNMNHSITGTNLKTKDKILEHVKSAVLTMLTKYRRSMEKWWRRWRNFSVCRCKTNISAESCSA